MELPTILTLLGLDSNEFDVCEFVSNENNTYVIYVTLKVPEERKCPHCGSTDVVIKDNETVKIKFSASSNPLMIEVLLNVSKKKFKCKKCNKTFSQQCSLVKKKSRISQANLAYIYLKTQELVSFSSIAKDLKISEASVRYAFDKMSTNGRKALTTAICIDEKKFRTTNSKYICVISDPYKGDILDIIQGRTSEYLNDYFGSLGINELQKVKFFNSDMFEGYRTLKKRFFPNALHIIDHFHITRLFTNVIQIMRKREMSKRSFDSEEYKILKRKWRIFLLNPFIEKNKKLLSKEYIDKETGEIIDYTELIKTMLRNCPSFLEIYNLYLDYCEYMVIGRPDKKLEESLEFIINKALNSTTTEIYTLGETLLNFSDEILNYFTSKNSEKLSNAIAESNNAKIQKLITISNGITSFKTLRKRILHLK